jgi:polar amino acid transport system substrate-binding protein
LSKLGKYLRANLREAFGMTLSWPSVFSFSVALAFATQEASAREPVKLVLNTGVVAPYTSPDRSGFLDHAIKEIFERIGRLAEVTVHEGTARALLLANDGTEDGAAMRVAGLETKYPSLVRIPEKLIDNFFVAFAAGREPETFGPEIFDRHQTAYISGWQVFERIVPPSPNVTRVQDARQLFDLLRNGRTEIVLYESWQGRHYLREQNIAARRLEPPIVRTEMFIYLHKKHAGLVDGAARALAEMKQDGRWDRIFADTLGSR